jgi:ribosome-associated protein
MMAFRVVIYVILFNLAAHGFHLSTDMRGRAKVALRTIDVRRALFMGKADGIEKKTPRKRKPNNRDKMIAGILEDTEFLRASNPPPIPLSEDPSLPMVEDIIRAVDKRKAKNIKAIRICHLTEVTTFMVICEGNSRPQNQAIANAVEEDVLLNFQEQPNKEGDAASGWVLLDYASVIVHIMTPQMRNFYKLEKRWKESEEMDIDYLLLPDAPNDGTYDASDDAEFFDSEGGAPAEDEDPFWS